MNRRGFIKLLAGAAAAIGLTRLSEKEPTISDTTDSPDMSHSFNSYDKPPRGSVWIADRDCPHDIAYIIHRSDYPGLGYIHTKNGWEPRYIHNRKEVI